MKTQAKTEIKKLLLQKVTAKLEDYKSETEYKPFFDAIFGKDVVVQASVMQSLYTSFGMSIYEQISIILANTGGYKSANRQYRIEGGLSDKVTLLIESICDGKKIYKNKKEELEAIRAITKKMPAKKHPDSTVDVYLCDKNGREICIDITTVKPNKKEVRALRRKMLIWSALRYSQDIDASIETYIGIPYNPYHPEPYIRNFVLGNCHRSELLIQDELWNLCANEAVFEDLLKVFHEVGKELKKEISHFLNR